MNYDAHTSPVIKVSINGKGLVIINHFIKKLVKDICAAGNYQLSMIVVCRFRSGRWKRQ
jgi:hypothetical protein